ncbi:MAG: DUF2059 domain-containing protein [Alphaproteobacteria bacterium]|nr:DUF2059 domain-containing protein [Alphaproteobacteria bacterium]
MKTESGFLRFVLLAILLGSLSPVALAETEEEQQPFAAKEEPAVVQPKPSVSPAAAKRKAGASQAKPKTAKPVPEKAKPAEAAATTPVKEPSISKPEIQKPEAQQPASAPQPVAPIAAQVSAPVPPPALKKEESGGFFKRLFGFGNKKSESPSAPVPRVEAVKHVASPPPSSAPGPFAPPVPPPDPAKNIDPKVFDAAMKVAKHFDVRDKVESAVRAPLRPVQSRLRAENMDKFDKLQGVIEEIVKTEAAKHDEDGQKNKAAFFAQNYSIDELKALNEFFGTPTGQKTIKLWALMVQRDMAFGQTVAAQQATSLREAVLKRAKKDGLKVPDGMEAK